MNCLKRPLWPLVFLLLIIPHVDGGLLFPANSEWKWRKGTSEPSPERSAWRLLGFPDANWLVGPGPLFYGENLVPGTLITDMHNNYSSFYLRKQFEVENLSQIAALDLDVKCDDGFIAWINGQEVARKNAPSVPAYNAFASQAAAEPAEFETYRINSPETLLRDGENVIAVQMFNIVLTSSDLVFDARLFTIDQETDPPVIIAVSPFPGTVTNLTDLTVTFNEPVQGVNASDLRINDRAAQSVTGAGATYTFAFTQPEFGSVQVAWSVDANIRDLALPPNTFDPGGASSRFLFDLADPSIPLLATLHPPANLTVRRLTEVEIYFTKPVGGVTAGDLVINGQPATNVTGTGAGPYLFQFPAASDGEATLDWSVDHGIKDLTDEALAFQGTGWSYEVDSQAEIPPVIITEISAANMTGLLDEDGSAEDWIELYNTGDESIDLAGWSLSDDETEPGKWVFPPVNIPANGFLVVFASGKDRKTFAGGRLHANFKLSLAGEYLGLFTPDAPRQAAAEFSAAFPEQRNDYSYGLASGGNWGYFSSPTPAQMNGESSISGVVAPVDFSVKRGFFQGPFQLGLYTPTAGAMIRYTLDGREPGEETGFLYTNLISIDGTRMVRAAAFKPNSLPSLTETHTYLHNIPASRRLLPALSLVTASNHLYGRTGIMEISPRNTIHHGTAWERPVSVEYIRPGDNEGFQIDCGIRIHGGGYVRERYNYRSSELPFSKYSYRLYFRGDYGASKLDYPLFPDIPLESFDEIVLRAGMNDHSNPFIRDELARALSADVGIVASHGTFVNLFLNGVYKGIYNPTERIDWRFLQQWHGGGEDWDVIAQSTEVREGDAVAWNALRSFVNAQSPAIPANYEEIGNRMDLVNFVDYLLPLIYADTDDWPHNNWRAARERTPDGKFRFYVWDAEWSFGYAHSPAHNTIANQLSALSPPWGSTEIQRLFTRLLLSPEFRLLFADRVHKHFFNGGALTDASIRARYEQIRRQVSTSIPGFNHSIQTVWIPQRRRYLTNHLAQARLIASSNAPVFSQFGGRVARGFELEVSAGTGTVYFTTNGVDPRVPFISTPHPTARVYSGPISIQESTLIKARTRYGTTWSALTEAAFEMERLGSPLRITEIMYNPIGGEAFEFLELQNIGAAPLSLGGISFDGIDYRFPDGTPPLPAGQRIVLANGLNPALFAQRYPGVQVAGYYEASLSNGGEVLTIKDPVGLILTQVTYDDEGGWPPAADGAGHSLEIIEAEGDLSSPANWQASGSTEGSPADPNSMPPTSGVRISEVIAENISAVSFEDGFPDWVEVHNSSSETANIGNWSLSDDSNPRKFVFPPNTLLEPNGYLVVWCGSESSSSGFHAAFALNNDGETLFLIDDETNRVDAVTFGKQIPDYSIGREMNGNWHLTVPTPGAPNESAGMANAGEVTLNELLADSAAGQPDWVELHNRNTALPASVGGFYLAIGGAVSRLPALSFILPGGFLMLLADEVSGPANLLFKLPAAGDSLALHDSTGEELDRVDYGAQSENVSQGRLPDGTGGWQKFPVSASPGEANYFPEYAGPVITEVLARNHSAAVAGWIELHNPLATGFDLGGMSLSVNARDPGEWTFDATLMIPAGGRLVITCASEGLGTGTIDGTLKIGEALNGEGGGVYLFNAAGQLVDLVEYGFQVPNLSIGKIGAAWRLTSIPSPGEANGDLATLESPNALRINEWMAAPMIGDDWFEVYNTGDLPVQLGRCFVTDDPSLHGRTNTRITELSFIEPRGFAVLQADGETDRGTDHVNFSLSASGETLRLYSSGFGIIDEVNMAPQLIGVSEGRVPDGGGEIANFPGSPTPGSANLLPASDSDGDTMPDDWELLYGLNPAVPDADSDFDGDGVSNRDEYFSGTDPAESESHLRLIAETGAIPDGLVLLFPAEAGRSYTIFFRDVLGSGEWERLTNIEAEGQSRWLEISDAAVEQSRFYRIVTPMQP